MEGARMAKLAVAAVVVLVGLASAEGVAGPRYTVTDLGLLPGGTESLARGINNDLQVVGYAKGADGKYHGFLWEAGVMTPLMQDWAQSEYDPAAALAMVDRWHPLGRMATAEEIGEVCAFLASREASFITGQVICPDGGASLGYAQKAAAKQP